MKGKKYNVDDVSFCTVTYIPNTCAFCAEKPVGLLEVKYVFRNRAYWICDSCRRKWIKGELTV